MSWLDFLVGMLFSLIVFFLVRVVVVVWDSFSKWVSLVLICIFVNLFGMGIEWLVIGFVLIYGVFVGVLLIYGVEVKVKDW